MNAGVILLYHRVVELPTDPQLLCVSPARFYEHLAIIRRVGRPLPLAELVRRAAEDGLPERAVAVTFDDGYPDNFVHAKPLLEAAQVPATLFATVGHTGTAREFFWDDLDRIFLQANTLPRTLELKAAAYTADLGDACAYSPAMFDAHRGWDVTQVTAPTPRQRAYRELCDILHAADVRTRAAALDELAVWSGLDTAGRPSHRMMNVEELLAIAGSGLVEIGAHTRFHPKLSAEGRDSQREEIGANAGDIVGAPVRGFSYPFGTRQDYTAETVAIVKSAGYAYACSNFNGLVTRATDPFQLPRFVVRNWDGEQFEKRLKGFLEWLPRVKLRWGCG